MKTGVHLGGCSSSRNLFDSNEDFCWRNIFREVLDVTTIPEICRGALCRKSSWQSGGPGGVSCYVITAVQDDLTDEMVCDLAIGDLRLMPCVESLLDEVMVKRRVPLVDSGGARWLADQIMYHR